jgi:hypothetical protein
MHLEVLALAITLMVGPGIMADIVLITAPKPVKVSAAFIAGVAIATTVGVLVALVSVLGNSLSLGNPSGGGSLGKIIQYLLVGLLIAGSVKNYVQCKTIEPPRWMGALQNATPSRAFKTGLLLVIGQPEDDAAAGRHPRA